MSPTSTFRMRRATALLAIAWALSAILPSTGALRGPGDGVDHPFAAARLGRAAVVEGVHPSAAERGVAIGDRILALDGEPYFPTAARSRQDLRAGVSHRYEFEKPDGTR